MTGFYGLLDPVNGAFEMTGGLMQLSNCYKLWRDKRIAGVYWPATAVFALWGLWNLLYYPSLGQWFSFIGGVTIVVANFLWVCMAIGYAKSR